MGRHRWLALALLALGCALTAAAQQVRNVQMPAPTRVDPRALKLDAPTLERNKARYRERRQRLSTHHLRVPLQPTSAPFAVEMKVAPTKVGTLRLAEADFVPGLKVKTATVTGGGGMSGIEKYPVSEPTLAIRGAEIFVTGNTYAALSLDAGKTFEYVDPMGAFTIPDHTFCCDQMASFDASSDTTYWLMQGYRNAEGNAYRLLFAKGRAGLENREWFALTIPSVEMLGRKGFWFDYPDLAFSAGHVYITANVYTVEDKPKYAGAAVMRFNSKALADHEPHQANVVEDRVGSLRLVQGASTVMYWSGQFSAAEVKIDSWKDGAPAPAAAVFADVERWEAPDGKNMGTVLTRDKRPWLRRLDERITTSWLAGDTVGLAWSAAMDNRFKLPHIRIAKFKVDDIVKATASGARVTPYAEPHIWSNTVAFAYPAVATNDRGEVGIAMAYATANTSPSFAVGILGAKDSDPPLLASALEGRTSPECPNPDPTDVCGAWGDYFTVRRDPANPSAWAVVGYTLQNRETQAEDAEAVLVRFGR